MIPTGRLAQELLTPMMPRLLVSLAVLVAAAAAPGTAGAQPHQLPDVSEGRSPRTADEHLETGLALYQSGDFEGAIAEFNAGYAVDPRPTFLFAVAQAERRSGDCASAIVYYERFLASGPSSSQAAAAREQRAKCVAALGSAPAADAPPEPMLLPLERAAPAAEPAPAPALVAKPPRGPSWYTSPLNDALVGGAAALTVAGFVFTLSAANAAKEANAAETYDDYGRAVARADRYRTIGLASLAGGVVVGGLAVWRIASRGDRPAERAARVELSLGPGVGLAVAGVF